MLQFCIIIVYIFHQSILSETALRYSMTKTPWSTIPPMQFYKNNFITKRMIKEKLQNCI